VLIRAFTITASWCLKLTFISKVYKRINILVSFKNNIRTFTTITTTRAAIWNVFFSTEAGHTIPTVTSFNKDARSIYKHNLTPMHYCCNSSNAFLI